MVRSAGLIGARSPKFARGRAHQRVRPLVDSAAAKVAPPAEEARLIGDVALVSGEQAVLAGARAFATVLFCGRDAEAYLEPLRRLIGDGEAGASHWQDKLVARVVAPDGFALRKKLIPLISHLRNGASVPKVWTL